MEISTPRGRVAARLRISGIRPGVVFLPFHYGYWDTDSHTHHRAANELTITDWDPVSKQPIFKTAAAHIRRCAAGTGPAPAPHTTASAPLAPRPTTTPKGSSTTTSETVTQEVDE